MEENFLKRNEFSPKIIGFLCNWCGYAAADLAGTLKLNYPAEIRILRVMCSGRVDPMHILDAFKNGADGVIIIGCHPGDCHYLTGNYRAELRVRLLRKLLGELGLEEDRLRIEWASAGEGAHFSEIVSDFVESIIKLGPVRLDVKKHGE